MSELLKVRNLNVDFLVKKEQIHVVNDVSFDVQEGEVLAIIGETGCGKSVTANAILHLLPENARVSGSLEFEGKNLLDLNEHEYRKLRGTKIMNVAQNPVTSLDPLMKIGPQVKECVTRRYEPSSLSGGAIKNRVIEILSSLKLKGKNSSYEKYACELSGGMCQRVLIAMGVITHPKLLIIGEPTKAIDWVLRKSVVGMLERLNKEVGCTLLVITHDIPFAEQIADRVAVFYAGEIVEIGATQDVLDSPQHPYTQGLINSSPSKGFKIMKGHMPAFTSQFEGCRFFPRCPKATEECKKTIHLQALSDRQKARCCYVESGEVQHA